ncbi:MAG: hypothetical protein CML43_02515 [Rhodobacteraceae bacterium]|nr:hypothetical protein [Paracoccaceae bacterium]
MSAAPPAALALARARQTHSHSHSHSPSHSHRPAACAFAPAGPLASALGGRGASNEETRPK